MVDRKTQSLESFKTFLVLWTFCFCMVVAAGITIYLGESIPIDKTIKNTDPVWRQIEVTEISRMGAPRR